MGLKQELVAFKSDGWKATPFIFMVEILENMASLSIALNLFPYIAYKMHFSLTGSANAVTNFMGTNFLMTLLGSIVSDMWLSRFLTITFSIVIECLGLLLLTLSAALPSLTPPACPLLSPSCQEAHGLQTAALFSGLYLLAVGSGGIKANLAALGAEQFDEDDPQEQRELTTYFNAFFLSLCMGGLIAVSVLVYIQDNVSFTAGYSVSLGSMVIAILIISAGYKFYHQRRRGRSPLISIAQVFVAAIWNIRQPVPAEEMLYEIHDKEASTEKNIKHTRQFRFLDKAAIIDETLGLEKSSPWRLCTVTQVEEVKILIRIFPIFASTIVMNCLLAQLQTFSLAQGRTMDRKLTKNFEIPPASLGFFPLFFMVIALPLYDRLFVPIARRFTGIEHGITHLQRISVGLVISTLCMVAAALVETKRLHVAAEHSLLDNPQATIPMKIFWITMQYSAFGIADVFTFVGVMQFFYSESPEGMRSMSTSLTWVGVSFGYYLSSVIVSLVKKTTSHGRNPGWLPDNINRGKLNNFYWLLAIISFINFVNYLFWAWWYKYRELVPQSTQMTGYKEQLPKDPCVLDEKNLELGPRLSIEGVGSVSARPLIAKTMNIA